MRTNSRVGVHALLLAAPGAVASAPCAAVPAHQSPGRPVDLAVTAGAQVRVDGTATSSLRSGALADPRISIRASTGRPYRAPLVPPVGARTIVLSSLGGSSSTEQPLCVVQVQGVPTVLVGLYTGGAHCCHVVRDFELDQGRWTWSDRNVGDAAAVLRSPGRTPLLVTANGAFSYRFTDFAASGLPVVVLAVRHGPMADVSTRQPGLLSADAARWWTQYRQNPADPLGYLAAWTADECRLGLQVRAFHTLLALEGTGRLADAATGGGASPWPAGGAYVSKLREFLVRLGYCTA